MFNISSAFLREVMITLLLNFVKPKSAIPVIRILFFTKAFFVFFVINKRVSPILTFNFSAISFPITTPLSMSYLPSIIFFSTLNSSFSFSFSIPIAKKGYLFSPFITLPLNSILFTILSTSFIFLNLSIISSGFFMKASGGRKIFLLKNSFAPMVMYPVSSFRVISFVAFIKPVK